jgi:hypothetical protein
MELPIALIMLPSAPTPLPRYDVGTYPRQPFWKVKCCGHKKNVLAFQYVSTFHIMSKLQFVFTSQYNSTPVTPRMMDEIGHAADEILITRIPGFQYTYFHLKKKARALDLANSLKTLEPAGVIGSSIFGQNTLDGNAPSVSEHLEDHPGFRALVDHEMRKNSEFSRWAADGYNLNGHCGYNLLKTRLLASQASGSSAPEPSASGGRGGDGGGAGIDDAHTRPSGLDREESKRQRTASPSGRSMVSLGEMFVMMNTTIASAVASSGSAVSSAFASERDEARMERQRREQAERQLHELQLKEERHRIEEEVAGKYRAEIEDMKAKVDGVGKTVRDLKEEHNTQMKAKDEAHAALLKTAKEVIVYCKFISTL